MSTRRKRTERRPSKLDQHRPLILEWAAAGLSGRQIQGRLAEQHDLSCSHTTVNEWLLRPDNVTSMEKMRREQLIALNRQTISAGSSVMARMLRIVSSPDSRDADAVAAGTLVMRTIGMDKALELMEAQGDVVASAARDQVRARIESMRSQLTGPPELAVVDAESTENTG